MANNNISEYIQIYFGNAIYEQANKIQKEHIKILSIKENPLKIRAIIFEKSKPTHIVIDEQNKTIFHDCPFSCFDLEEDDLCVHIIKLLLSVNSKIAMQIFQDWNLYTFKNPSDGDISQNFYLISKLFYDSNLLIDSLHFLNEAIFYTEDNLDLIKKYLTRVIEKKFFGKLFVFVENLIVNYPNNSFVVSYKELFRKGLIKLFKSVPSLSLSELLIILQSFHRIGHNLDLIVNIEDFIEEIQKLLKSKNSKSQLFSYFLLILLSDRNTLSSEQLEVILNNHDNTLVQNNITKTFDDYMENIHSLNEYDYVRFIINKFDFLQGKFKERYDRIRFERQQIENRFHVRRVSFLKLLIKRSKIFLNTKISMEKVRDTYIISHDQDNLKNPLYSDYLLPKLGFFGKNNSAIKSQDIAQNLYLFTRLFQANWTELPDVSYFKEKYWSEVYNSNLKSKQGFPLMRYGVDYTLDAGLKFANIDEIIIIEWDLADNLYHGVAVMAFGTSKMIPEYENPLSYDIKPFDLCFCFKNPKEIDIENIKVMKVISKCSFKDAIYNVSKGIDFIEGSYPLSLILKVINDEISPLEAINILDESPKKRYVPHFYQFIHEFKEYIFNEILKSKFSNIGDLKKISDSNVETIINLIGLTKSLSGIQLPYSELIKLSLEPEITRDTLRSKLIKYVHDYIQPILNSDKIGNTIIFDLSKMKDTPFSQYSKRILQKRREEFEAALIYKTEEKGSYYYDLSNIALTYYGIQISKILKIMGKLSIKETIFERFMEISQKIGLKINIVINNN